MEFAAVRHIRGEKGRAETRRAAPVVRPAVLGP
jgi:hypothetical protein